MSARAQDAAIRQQCLFGTEASHCGAIATVHVLQLDGSPTMSCPAHVDWWLGHGFTDMHPTDPTCGMPSCLWIWSSPGSPGRCVVEGLDVDEHAVAEVAIP